MASKTANYNLDMPAYNEIADIDVINGNMDKIDVQMKKNADSAQQSKDIVSDEYSATNTYAVGDYCIHENALYKCKTAITTGEAFDSSKWVQTTCGTEVAELNSNLTDLAFGENSGSANIFNGKIVDGLLIENGEISDFIQMRITSDFIPVEPNTLYTQIAPTSAKKGRYCEYDANKNLVYFDTNGLQDTFTTKPTTKYLRISFGREYGTTFKNDIAIIKGNATEYVPYIPSVKMLADEVSAQKNDLTSYNIELGTIQANIYTDKYYVLPSGIDSSYNVLVSLTSVSNTNDYTASIFAYILNGKLRVGIKADITQIYRASVMFVKNGGSLIASS